MKNYCILFFLYAWSIGIPNQFKAKQTVVKNGMEIRWEFKGKQIDFEVFAPTRGWVALGFNEQESLVGSQFVMGKIVDGTVTASDRYVVGFGNHKPVTVLGGVTHLFNVGGQEDEKG